MTAPRITLDQGETITMPRGQLQRRNRHRAQSAACRDCRWTMTGPATPGQAAQHARHEGHVVDFDYAVAYTYVPPNRTEVTS